MSQMSFVCETVVVVSCSVEAKETSDRVPDRAGGAGFNVVGAELHHGEQQVNQKQDERDC